MSCINPESYGNDRSSMSPAVANRLYTWVIYMLAGAAVLCMVAFYLDMPLMLAGCALVVIGGSFFGITLEAQRSMALARRFGKSGTVVESVMEGLLSDVIWETASIVNFLGEETYNMSLNRAASTLGIR